MSSPVEIHRTVPQDIKEMIDAPASEGYPQIGIIKITRRIPKYNLMRCTAALSIVTMSGEGIISWWYDDKNRHEQTVLTTGCIINIAKGGCFALEGKFQVMFISSPPERIGFESIEIN
ncbi:MAG: hypothetical protein V4524_03515 [Patescibacteria group bacterium]